MAAALAAAGCDAIHTLDLTRGNRTPDDVIASLCVSERRIVITKDSDFVDSHLLRGRPPKLLLISTGNITNRDLDALFNPLIPTIVHEFQTHAFLELGRAGLVLRG